MKRYNIYFLLTAFFCCFLQSAVIAKQKRSFSKKDIVAFNNQTESLVETTYDLSPKSMLAVNAEQEVPVAADHLEKEFEQPVKTEVEDRSMVAIMKNLDDKGSDAPEEAEVDAEEFIEFNFENADLINLVKQVELIFDISFLSDDAIEPLLKGARAIKGNKLTFKTQHPLTRTQAWELFVTFMQIAGLSVVKHALPRTYRITNLESARKMPMPSFIGSAYTELPDSDELIRFVYFIENSSMETIKTMVDALRSSASTFIILQEQKAFILTDRAYNIKKLMEIIKEVDKAAVPQTMSLLQLKQADARTVKELYDTITGDEKNNQNRFAPPTQRKQPTSSYFPENLKMIVEPRRNALILIGPYDATKKVEEFITKYIDTELSQPYAAFFVYQLKYADANTIADIMNNVTQFGKDTEAGKFGGTRGKDQYMKSILFVPEKETNRLVIKGKFEDYMTAVEILEKLDAPPVQVEVEMLILSVVIKDTKSIGAQIRSKEGNSSLLGQNIKFQTSGLFQNKGIVENFQESNGVTRLLGNLLQLVQGAASGNTILSLGSDLYNVWGVFQALQTVANTNTIANPFLTVTNKTPAIVSLGQTRRVVTSTIVGSTTQTAQGDQAAELRVEIEAQVNSDGMIKLNLNVKYDDFTNSSSVNDGTKNVRQLKTSTTLADGEVLGIGGLARAQSNDDMNKTPFFGDLPGIGLLFKNKQKAVQKDNLLILLTCRIVDPHDKVEMTKATQKHADEYYLTLGQMASASDRKDPVHKMFFEEPKNSLVTQAEDSFFGKVNSNVIIKRKRVRKSLRLQKKAALEKPVLTAEPKELEKQIAQTDKPIPLQVSMVEQEFPVQKLKQTKKVDLSALCTSEHTGERV